MRQIFSSGSLGETCALPRAAAAAAAARAAAASASGFCANAAGPKRLAATRQLAVSIQIFLIPSSLGPCWAPLNFLYCGQSIALASAMEIVPTTVPPRAVTPPTFCARAGRDAPAPLQATD